MKKILLIALGFIVCIVWAIFLPSFCGRNNKNKKDDTISEKAYLDSTTINIDTSYITIDSFGGKRVTFRTISGMKDTVGRTAWAKDTSTKGIPEWARKSIADDMALNEVEEETGTGTIIADSYIGQTAITTGYVTPIKSGERFTIVCCEDLKREIRVLRKQLDSIKQRLQVVVDQEPIKQKLEIELH